MYDQSVMDDIIREFKTIERLESKPSPGAEGITRSLAFKKMIANHHDPEYLPPFYNLLRNCKIAILRSILRKDFITRPNAEGFLIDQSKIETDSYMQGEILQLLGHMKSSCAAPMAREYLNHNQNGHREVALFVLGWVGTENDIPLLTKHLLMEQEPHLRITAASAHRQLAHRMPELKMKLILSLKQGFENEKDDEVIPWIIIMIETVLIKRLGIREDKDNPDVWHGDLEKAKKKTVQFLATLNKDKL